MNRVIIAEEQPKEENQEQQSAQQGEQSQNVNFGGGVTISAAELEQMFYEWDATGKNDLTVNDSIAGRIEAYLAYQETLKPLKIKLAEEQFERFLVDKAANGFEAQIYLNSVLITNAVILYKNDIYGYMYFDDFRSILCSCKNPYAYYPYKNEKKIIDVRGWVLEHGGTLKRDGYNIEITMSL